VDISGNLPGSRLIDSAAVGQHKWIWKLVASILFSADFE
jgi:hypothetical protein